LGKYRGGAKGNSIVTYCFDASGSQKARIAFLPRAFDLMSPTIINYCEVRIGLNVDLNRALAASEKKNGPHAAVFGKAASMTYSL
jgi:hypothetical protein